MASGGAAEDDDGVVPLDIDNIHMLLQVEQEQIQKRTFTNWINAQLAKRCPPSFVSDLFSDLRDGTQLLDLLEVMSGQSMKRQRGRGVFQQRANIETALNFLKKKSIKLVNINIPDIIDGRPSIILGLVWTIILHCHIEELACALSFSSRHSSLDSLASLDSWSGSPVPSSPVPGGRTSPLHRRFRISAKKALLMWVRDQCQKVNCSVSVKDFKSSWRSGEAFLAILCSLRPQLVDLSLVQSRSNQENLEEVFHLAEQELHIPRLLEPQDVDVKDPDEKSIMTYVAQFLQYSNDMPAPDDHLQLFPLVQPFTFSPVSLPPHFTPAIAVSPLHQVSPSERAQQVMCWLQQAYEELSDARTATETSSYAEKYHVFQSLAASFTEQRKPVMSLLASTKRCPELNQEQRTLRMAWDRLEEEMQRCKTDLDLSLPPPLDSVVVWLQRAEAELKEGGGGGRVKDHADAAKEARAQQDTLKTLTKEMTHYITILDDYPNMDDCGNVIVPLEKFEEIKKRLTNIRVTAKYQGIKLEYQESRHTVLDLLRTIRAKVQSWKAPYRSQENIHVLLQDWHETVERQDLLLILMDTLQNQRDRANACTSKAALSEDSQLVTRQVKEAESEAELVSQAVKAVRGTMERVGSAWETYNRCLASLQGWLTQKMQGQSPAVTTQDMSDWTSCQAQLNEAGNFLIEMTETSTSLSLAEQLSKVNMQWAECMKKTMFEVSSEPSVGASCLHMVHSLTLEASCLLRQPLDVASVPLKANRQKLQLLSKKLAEVDVSSLSSSPDLQTSHMEKLQQTLPQTLAEAERTCGELQRAASGLEGRLAELDHWNTDALDCYNHLKEKMHRGHSALDPTAKVLISRGLQVMDQVITEGQDLQDLVAGLQKTSSLHHLSTSRLQDRISEATSHCQEILEMFSSLGFKHQLGEFPRNQSPSGKVSQTQKQTGTGLFVVARTKHVDQTGYVLLQAQDKKHISPPSQSPQERTGGLQGWSKNRRMNTQDEKGIVVPYVVIQKMPEALREAVPQSWDSPTEAKSDHLIDPQSFSKSEKDQLLPAVTQTPASPVLSKHLTSSVSEEKKSSSPSQTPNIRHKCRTKGQPDTLQSGKPPLPPAIVHSDVHSKAQSMARSRLEKARTRLQGRIQQAIKLFGSKEISESQAKKKQKALKILQPAVLEEFLGAMEGYGAFCSGPQLQDLMLLSDSVRKQWEDVRREMAAFVPILWSQIREGQQPFSVVSCETHTNAVHGATDHTDCCSVQQKAATEGAAAIEERVESLSELSETLTPRKSSGLAADQLTESDEVQETRPSDTALPAHGRGRQLGGNTPLGATDMSADTQPSNGLPQKQSVDGPLQHLSAAVSAAPPQLQQDESKDHLTQNRGSKPNLKPSLRAKEQLLKARLLHITGSDQQNQTQIQAVVRSNTVESKQEAEWTVLPEATAPPQEEQPSGPGVLDSYRKSCSVFQSKLQENKLHLEQFILHPVTILTLQNQRKQLQTLKQETDALWFDVELHYAQLSQLLISWKEEDQREVGRKQQQLTQQWREQQICLQTRMSSLEKTAELVKSADHLTTLITEKLDQISKESVDISSLTLPDPTMLPDLKEMDDRLRTEMRKLSEQSTQEERRGPGATSPSSLCQPLHNGVHHLERLRQQLEKVHSAARALDRLLAAAREVEAEIPTPLANRDPSRQKNEADWEQERHRWQAAMQRLQEQSEGVDSSLEAAGMTLTMDGAAVTCQDVVKSVSKRVVAKKLMRDGKQQSAAELCVLEKTKKFNPTEICQIKTPDNSWSGAEELSGLEAKRSRLEGENGTGTQRGEEHGPQMRSSEGDVLKTNDQRRRRRSSQVKKEGGEKEMRAALLTALRETKEAAEQLRLQESTLPALQQRTRALTALESRLAGLLPEVQLARGASEISDVSQTREVEDLWEEATKAVTERLEQCRVLTELLKRFQSVRGELSGTLQRAESTISEQASYMGRDNLQRLHTKVQETKAELNGLGDRIEEVRSVCRQLHTHLRQTPECTTVLFESEADALMDRWLDLSERTDSHLENLHFGLTLWDGVLQLGTEVETWTTQKIAAFAQCPSFRAEDDIKELQNEIATQEESLQRFHRRAAEIQTMLQSTESPLELQVVETQVRKKLEQLKELVSEAEDVYKQTVATKEQISVRMAECFSSLQNIQDSLLALSGPDVATVLAKLKELCWQLHAQDEQAESLQEDVRVMASIAGPESLQSLCESGTQLQEKVRNTQQLFSEVEEQTERNIQDLDRLQTEREHLEHWLHAAEEDVGLLQEEALQQSARTEFLRRLVSSLQSSNLQQLDLVEESKKLLERLPGFHTDLLSDSKETQDALSRDVEAFRGLSESTRSWIGDMRLNVESKLVEHVGIQSPVEQRLHCAQVVLSATGEGEARLEELRVTGGRLSSGDNLKQEVQETIQKTEEQWTDLLQSVQPYYRALQADPELASSYLTRTQEACCRVGELQNRADQLPAVFPWPGTAERTQARLRARQLQEESVSLHLTLTSLDEQRRELSERTGSTVWKDPSWAEMYTRWSAVMEELKGVCSRLEEGASNEEHFGRLLQDCRHKLTSLQGRMSVCQVQKGSSAGLNTDVPALEALLQEVKDIEKDLLGLETLKDSIAVSSTAEARANLCQQVSDLRNHKAALEGSIRENLLRRENKELQTGSLRSESGTKRSASTGETTATCPPASPENDQIDSKVKTNGIFYTLEKSHPSTELVTDASGGLNVEADATKLHPASDISVLCAAEEEALSSDQQESQLLTSSPPKMNVETHLGSKDEIGSLCTDTGPQSSMNRALSGNNTELLMSDTPPPLNQSLIAQPLQKDSAWVSRLSATGTNNTSNLDNFSSQAATDAPEPEKYCDDVGVTTKKVFTVVLDMEPQDMQQRENTEAELCDARLREISGTGFPEKKPGVFTTSDNPESGLKHHDVGVTTKKVFKVVLDMEDVPQLSNTDAGSSDVLRCSMEAEREPSISPESSDFNSCHLPKQSETFQSVAEAPEQEKHSEDVSRSPDKVFKIVLDMETQQWEKDRADDADVLRCSQEVEVCDAMCTKGPPEKKPGLLSASLSPESDKAAQSETCTAFTDAPEQEKHCGSPDKVFTIMLDMELQQSEEVSDVKPSEVSNQMKSLCTLIRPHTDLKQYLKFESSLSLVNAELQDLNSASATIPHNNQTSELKHNEVLTSSGSCSSVPECQLTAAHAAETTIPDVKHEVTTDSCHSGEPTASSVSCTAEVLVQTGDASSETQIPTTEDRQGTTADTARTSGATCEEMAKGENTEEEAANDSESTENKGERRDNDLQPKEEGSEWKLPAGLEETEVTQGQPQIQEAMEPGRTALGLPADLGAAAETTGGSAKSCKRRSSMQDILSEIQSLVERSNIINRTPHIDLNWFLKSSPGEPEIRLVRTLQQVLACRYQPAQLSVTVMAKQLQDAEEHRRCVHEQVASLKSTSTPDVCDPNALKSAEAQWSAALLDASATVQVKAAQLDQVKQYHRQMKMSRAFLKVLAAEKNKMSLNALGSSALQAEKLNVLLQTMEQKKCMMEDLLHLSSQLSVHLSDAESSGALLAQLGDVQEEWRLLKGSIKRALQHASNSTSQSWLLLKEAEQLKAKLEALHVSDCESPDTKSALELVCLTTDLKLYNQLYLHLQSQSDALTNFSLGQKEKDEIKRNLQELGSLLGLTKTKLNSFTYSCGGNSSAKINKQLQDLIVWAKQAENHISIGKKLALFPEEARIQIVEMKKFQTDILSRRSKMRAQVEEMKDVASDMDKEESDQVLKTVEDLYEAIADSLDHVLDTMKKDLHEREKLLSELASMDAWLAETHVNRDPCTHVENVSRADVKKLESELKSHKSATVDIETQLKLVEAMSESCRKIAVGLSPGESRYLVNRLSGLWTELDGLLANEKATSWELEELIHERTSSDEELSTIQGSLKQISSELKQQKFPLTQETLSTIAILKRRLMEHQCEVQELQHCQETKRSSLLCAIGELQDRCKALSINAFEQDKYLHLKKQMEESRDIANEQIQHAKNKAISMGERFRLCQTLLVELPLVKTQCQEAADQLEAIAQELYPSEINTERARIHSTVETLVSWEHSVTDDIKNLEAKLLLGLRFNSELPALIEQFQRSRAGLDGAELVDPEEKAIDTALQRYWIVWRNLESGMRVLEGLGRKEKINLRKYKELYSLRDAAMQECHSRMVSLSQARESLKDYQWAAQGAIGFLHNAEATFLSAPGGFVDCTEEQGQTQQALEALEDGFQAHICHLVERVPQQACLSRPKTEQLHINILSQLLVGRAILEAQAQLRLETLQRCEMGRQSHKKCHEDIRQRLSGFEARISECATEHVTSFDKCVAQQRKAELLMEDLRSLAGKIEDLRAGCPMQGCGVGKDGELGALWRRWVSLRRGIGLLMAHTEQRGEEWKDITASMEQCCSFLASLQAEVPDSSTVSFTQEEPQELLAQAEMHQAGLEQEQQALASLEHRLEHALSLSSSQEPVSPGPVGKTLVKIQENVRSLKERNLQVVAAAQAEEKERQQVEQEIGDVEKHLFDILPALETCSDPRKRQELKKDLSSQRTKLKRIMDGVQSRYPEVPADIGRQIQEVQLSLQRAEQKLMEKNSPVRKLANRVLELDCGLEKVKALLEQRSPTVSEAQHVLKRVWDELDTWHSSLTLLESEVQDLAEEQPDQAQLLIDQLTQPLQLYQNASQMAELRTAFLSRIPACLQEFEDSLCSATCWLGEAQLWLSTPCAFTTAKSLQSHAKSLQLVLDESERIRHNLQDFRSMLDEVSAVCEVSNQQKRLDQTDQQVHNMQRSILVPLEQLLQAVAMVEAMEAELKTMEKNIPKIRTILSSVDASNIPPSEHLLNRRVILANVQSMRRTLGEIERCRGELHIPQGADQGLQVFSRARLLLQPLEELEQLTQQQTSQLENKIRVEGETNTHLGITTVSHAPGELDTSSLFVQEAFEVSNSEEEEDEEGESCHSSSSDTLTCSIPEDPDETLNLSDVQSEDMAEMKPLSNVKELESLTPSSEVETSSKGAETRLLPVKPGSDTNIFGSKDVGLTKLDSKAEVGKAFSPEYVTDETPNTTDVPAAGYQVKAASTDQQESPKHETFARDRPTESPQASAAAAAAVEDTRLIPSRPITPFTAKRALHEFILEEDEDPSLSTAPRPDLAANAVKEQNEASISRSSLVERSQRPQGFSEDDEEIRQRWSRLHSQISQKLTTLKKVKEEHQGLNGTGDEGNGKKVPEKELISTGSASAVLQRTHESITMLRQVVSSADSSHPGAKEDFYEAARRVLLCLDSLTDLLLTPAGGDEPELRLLQEECVSAELATLSDLMGKVEPQTTKEGPDAHSCLTGLQDCLHTVQQVFTSSHNQLSEHSGPRIQQQELPSNQLCLLDEFESEQNEILPTLKAPSFECALGPHLRESPGEKAELQHASRSLLRGIARLLELGEEREPEKKTSQVPNRGKLQATLSRRKKLLQVLGSQLAFVQYLFQHEPEALGCQEDERVQLEIRAKALQQQALEQDVASQRRLQEWTRWEDNCGQLGRVLDESEAFISSGEPEGDDDEESVQRRLDACQETLVQLDGSRAALGLVLDQGKDLQADPGFAASVSQAGGALELRWRSAYRRTEQEVQRCRDIQDSRSRFQSDFATVSERLVDANKHLKALSGLADSSDPNQEAVQSNLIKLLDFSMEVESMSKLKASVSKDATHLLHLREADCPELRAQVTELEVNWNQLTSDLSKTQDQLQQCLLAAQPPVELLSELEDWLNKMEARLNREKEKVLKAKNGVQIREILQHHQALKAAVANGQLLLDFLCQPGPQMMGTDVQDHRSERTAFAEKLGAVRLKSLHLQRELESQIRGAEQIHHAAAERERRLQRLHVWMEQQQQKQLNQWKRPNSQTLARKALLEWEDVVGRVKEAAAALRELETRRDGNEEERPCDVALANRAQSIGRACRDLSQQMEALRPVLQRTVDEWSCFHRGLRDVALTTTRVRCVLQHQQAPLFSVKQAEGYADLLQQLQVEAGKGEELFAAVDKSYQSLVETLHPGAAEALSDQVEAERKRWKDVVQEIKDEQVKAGRTLSLWEENTRLSDRCSHHLLHLQRQWEELWSSSLSPEQDTEETVSSVKKLQDAAEELQSSVGNVLASSKPLIGRLEPLAANLIQSETRLLSRDILLLNQAMSGKEKSLQEESEQRKLFQTRLEALEKQTQDLLHKLNADSVKEVLLELSDLFPSLVDIRDMSGYVTLDDQETDRLHTLSKKWTESMTRIANVNRELQEDRQRSQSFQQKCKNLTSLQEKLEEELVCRKPLSYSNLQERLTVHQRLQAEVMTGHQLLQGLLRDAVEATESGEKRSELMNQVSGIKESWLKSVALVGQNRTQTREQLHQWRIYHRGLKLLWKQLRDVDSLLPPTGPSSCLLHQLQSSADQYQRVEESLGRHSPVYAQTLEAGKYLCEAMTESECRSRLQSELQAIEENWERSTSLLGRRRDLVNSTVQTWSQCQEEITNIMSELDELKLKPPLSERPKDSGEEEEEEEEEALIQETEISLQRLAGGLRRLATMKTDLSQYVAASDSALLEQQLEQLHSQWEELCMKVSLRRQEIADRLNAWTIFNDKNKEFCDWLTQMENKVCHSGELSIEEMVEKLKKDCMEEINLFSENKSHLKQLGEQLLLASDEAKQTQVHGSLQEVNQRWHNLFHHIEARVKKLKETLVTVQQLDKNMSNLRSWLSRIEAELSRPITYSVCHQQEIQRRLAEQQELQRDIEQHTEGVASVLSLCDVLLRDEDAAGGTEAESDSLQETSRSLDQRWRTICAMALDRRLRIEETWTLWCKFLDDYSRFEDWLKMAERTAANPNSADVLFTVAKEELKKFEGFQRQVHERLTQLELVNNQYRRLARENRTDRASQLKAMVHEGNRRWDTLHRRVAAILRRLKYFTSQREEFEGTRESMLVWLTELDLQLTNVEHFSESDVHHKIQQLNSFQKEITLNTERIDGLIVFGEGLIQKSSPQDAVLIEDELEELHSYCQEVFSRLVRFHQRLSQPPMINEEPELSGTTFSLESSLGLIGRPWLGRSHGSLPATPTHLLTSPLERSGRETPVSVDSLPLEWDHTGDVGGSSSHEDDEEDEEEDEEGAYFSALSVPSRSMAVRDSPRWRPPGNADTELDTEEYTDASPTFTSTPLKQGYLRLMSQCSGSIENIKRVSLILDDEEQAEELGLTGLNTSDKQSGVIERWELLQARSRCDQQAAGPQEPRQLASDLDDITSWLENVSPELERLQRCDPAASVEDMEARARELREMQKTFARYKSVMLSVNLRAHEAPELQERLSSMNRDWSRVSSGLTQWDSSLRRTLLRCQEFHETLHSLLLWLAHAESRRYAVDINHPETTVRALQQHRSTLTELQEELRGRQTQQAALQALWSQLQPEDGAEDEDDEAQEKLHVTGSKLKTLLRQVEQDLGTVQQRLDCESASADTSQEAAQSKKGSSTQRERREASPPRSFFYRVLRAAFPLQLLLLLLLILPCLIPLSESDPGCTVTNNFARSFYPMLHYTNGPPPT